MKIYFHLLLFLTVFNYSKCYPIEGKCGFPGLPYDTKVEPHKMVYEEGETVRYSCPSDRVYVKTQVKTCVSGQWTGMRSTCGNFIKNQLSRVKVIDLTTNLKVVDINTSNYSEDLFPASFYDGRGTGLVITEADRPHKWWFEFSNSIVFDFFLLNIMTPKTKIQSKVESNEIDSIRVKDVQVLNDEMRNCSLDFLSRINLAKIFWFWCTQSTAKVLNKSLTISFITYANHKIESIGLHQVYFTKLQYCGRPPIPLLAKYYPQNEEREQIQCDPNLGIDAKSLVNSSVLLDELNEEQNNDCVDDEYWSGNPKCLPKYYCGLNFDNSSEEITSVKSAYIFSQTQWYAIDGTTVSFSCKPGYEFISDSVRTCLNSKWDQPWPVCKESSFISNSIMIGVIFVGISVTIIAILKG